MALILLAIVLSLAFTYILYIAAVVLIEGFKTKKANIKKQEHKIYEEVYNRCVQMAENGEVTYFSLQDIRSIIDNLEGKS